VFETEIIDGQRDQRRTLFFDRLLKVVDIGLTRFGLLLLAGLVVYFLRFKNSLAIATVLMIFWLMITVYLIVKYFFSRRINKGRLKLSADTIQLSLHGKTIAYPISELESLVIYQYTDLADPVNPKNIRTFYGDNWIVFLHQHHYHKFEFALDSDYKEKQLQRLVDELQPRFSQFQYLTTPNNFEGR
jgi:hypothetical protein